MISKPVAVTMTSTSCTVPSSVSMPFGVRRAMPSVTSSTLSRVSAWYQPLSTTGRRENGA